MVRFVCCLVIFIALSLLFGLSTGFGQVRLEKPPVSGMCDLHVGPDGYEMSITWPKQMTPRHECMALLRELLPRLKDGNNIYCQCQEGAARS